MATSHDSLQRFVFEGAPVRGEIVHLDATWRAVLERHEYPLPLRTVLGELMAADLPVPPGFVVLRAGYLDLNGNPVRPGTPGRDNRRSHHHAEN